MLFCMSLIFKACSSTVSTAVTKGLVAAASLTGYKIMQTRKFAVFPLRFRRLLWSFAEAAHKSCIARRGLFLKIGVRCGRLRAKMKSRVLFDCVAYRRDWTTWSWRRIAFFLSKMMRVVIVSKICKTSAFLNIFESTLCWFGLHHMRTSFAR